MSLRDLVDDYPPTYSRDRTFVDAVDEIFPAGWRDGPKRPYQFLSLLERYLELPGRDPVARYRRARLDVARAYEVGERRIRTVCQSGYSPKNGNKQSQFLEDLETLEGRLTDN